MNVSDEPKRASVQPEQAPPDSLESYTIVIPAGQDWDDQTIYAYMCADIAQRNTLPLDSQRFAPLVDAQIATMQVNGTPLITPPLGEGALRPRGEFMVEGRRVVGYQMEIKPDLQREILSRAEAELLNPPPPAQLSEEYTATLGRLDQQALELQEKFRAMDQWFQGKNTRHGLDAYTGYYLDRADGLALSLQDARNEAKNPNLLNSETRLLMALKLGNEKMDELFKDHRNLRPEDIVKRLNDRYEAGFEQAKQAADLIGKIPGPVGAVGEFGINEVANALRYSSNDRTVSQALAEFTKDGSKMVVSLAVKTEKAEKLVDKVANFLGDTATNVAKRVSEAETALKDNPTWNRQEVMRNAILHGVGDATVNAIGGVKLDRFGLGAGAGAIKEFGTNLTKNIVEEYRDTTRKLAKEESLDSAQLYKEAAARALIKATGDTVGKSLKSLGGDAKEREFLIEVGTKLGIQDTVKSYLDAQKSQAEPKKAEPPVVTGKPVAALSDPQIDRSGSGSSVARKAEGLGENVTRRELDSLFAAARSDSDDERRTALERLRESESGRQFQQLSNAAAVDRAAVAERDAGGRG